MGIVRGVGGRFPGRLAALAVGFVLVATACGGGDEDRVALPAVPTGVLAAVQLSVGDLALDADRVEEGTGVFLVPRSRIVFAGVTCTGDPDERLSIEADGQLLETLGRARLGLTVGEAGVEPSEGELEILVGGPGQGLAFVSGSRPQIDGGLVSIEGVYEPRTERTPLAERLVGGSFRLVVRCPTRGS